MTLGNVDVLGPVGRAAAISSKLGNVFRSQDLKIPCALSSCVFASGAQCNPITAGVVSQRGLPEDPVFPSIHGGRLSRDEVERLITKYTQRAERTCPSLKRNNVSPHVMRHTAAMDLLQHGVDRSVIALWLGHESMETTQMYLHADLRLKQNVLARTSPLGVKLTRYRPDDKLLAFLESL